MGPTRPCRLGSRPSAILASNFRIALSGLLHREGRPLEQAQAIFDAIEDIVVNDLDGELADVCRLKFYIQEDVFTTEFRNQLHELRRDRFACPDYPAATMVGVTQLIDDAAIEIDTEAFIPRDEWNRTVMLPED